MVYSLFNPLIISILFFAKNVLTDEQCGWGQVYYENQCVKCPTGCAECISPKVERCKKCFCPAMLEEGKYCKRHDDDYNPSQCVLITCPGQDYFINNRYECQKCPYGCKICDNANTCLKCHCLYTLINRQCFGSVGNLNYENCDENEYKENLRCIKFNEFNNNGKCQTCAPICKTFIKTQTTCTSCNEGYKYFAHNNSCVSDGNYLDIKFINIICLILILFINY